MKATELRIGNWVQRMTHAGYIKDQVHLGRENENTGFEIEQHDYFEPISLTEKWLIKFGVEDLDLFIHDVKTDWSAPCDYVHQLQNIYFALTGEELQIQE